MAEGDRQMSPDEVRQVERIIAWRDSPAQQMARAFRRAPECAALNLEYMVETNGGWGPMNGEAMFLADAIGWASK